MHVLDIMNRLASTASRTDKEQILIDAYMAGHRDFFIGASLACDPLISFGVAKAALIEDEDDAPGSFTFNDFLNLAAALRRRELTGNAARDAINGAAERSHAPTWNRFYRRVLLKDLGVGTEEKTINKVLEKLASAYPEARDYMIPIFGCQLAHDGADDKHAKKVAGRKLLDVKLDGVRLLSILDKDAKTVTQYTRNGRVNANFTEITDRLAALMGDLPGSVVLDGEVVASSFQDLMTQVNRRDGVDTSKTRLALFDMVPLDDFRAGVCSTRQEERHAYLTTLQTSGLLQQHCGEAVYVIPKVAVDLATEEGRAAMAQFNREAIEAGYEGVMVKSPDAPYQCKRSDAWLKIKPWIEVSLTIVAVEEGKPDSKYVGMLGALVCEGEDDGRRISVNVGSGFSDEQRRTLWQERDRLNGMIVEVRADAMTKEQGGDVWSLRFPRFKGFRGTKPGEKL